MFTASCISPDDASRIVEIFVPLAASSKSNDSFDVCIVSDDDPPIYELNRLGIVFTISAYLLFAF